MKQIYVLRYYKDLKETIDNEYFRDLKEYYDQNTKDDKLYLNNSDKFTIELVSLNSRDELWDYVFTDNNPFKDRGQFRKEIHLKLDEQLKKYNDAVQPAFRSTQFVKLESAQKVKTLKAKQKRIFDYYKEFDKKSNQKYHCSVCKSFKG